jgi:hypothetical protein
MESYSDLISSVILAAILTAVIIPLIRYARYLKKENDRLENIGHAKDVQSDR